MRKTTALLFAALLTASMSACDKKKSDSKPDPVDTTLETTEAAEQSCPELTDADFSPIELNSTITDKEAPVKIYSADLSKIDFGESLSPCKAEEYRDKFGFHQTFDDRPDLQEEYDRSREVLCNTPSKGHIDNIVFLDEMFYFVVNYDDLCRNHDSALYSFDPKTGEYMELDRRTGIEYNGCYSGLIASGGRLFFFESDGPDITDENAPQHSTVYAFDPKTRKISEFLSVDYNVYWLQDSANGLYVSGSINYPEEERTEERNACYDPETGLKLDSSVGSNYRRIWGMCDGMPIEVMGGLDDITGESTGENITVKTQYYTITTGFKKVNNVFAWKYRLSVVVDEGTNMASEMRLYTYDINAMERTKMKLNGFNGSCTKAGEGLFSLVQSSDYNVKYGYNNSLVQIYYIMPQLGTVFRMEKVNSSYVNFAGDIMYILTSKPDKNPDDERYYAGMYGRETAPDKIYWFEMEK